MKEGVRKWRRGWGRRKKIMLVAAPTAASVGVTGTYFCWVERFRNHHSQCIYGMDQLLSLKRRRWEKTPYPSESGHGKSCPAITKLPCKQGNAPGLGPNAEKDGLGHGVCIHYVATTPPPGE